MRPVQDGQDNSVFANMDMYRIENVLCYPFRTATLVDNETIEGQIGEGGREERSLPQSPPSPPSPSSPPLPHKCPVFPQEPCRRQKCRLRIEQEKEKEALGKTCTHRDVMLIST